MCIAVSRLACARAAVVLARATLTIHVAAVTPLAGAKTSLVMNAARTIGGVDFMAKADAFVAYAGSTVFPVKEIEPKSQYVHMKR